MNQHSNKFFAAVRTLAGNGPIKKRLTAAYGDNLVHLPVEELPESIQPRFESLRRTMLSVKPTGDESPVLATVRKMSATDAKRCANHIVAMYSELEQAKNSSKRLDKQSTNSQSADLAASRFGSLN